jgi:hypothetical protein
MPPSRKPPVVDQDPSPSPGSIEDCEPHDKCLRQVEGDFCSRVGGIGDALDEAWSPGGSEVSTESGIPFAALAKGNDLNTAFIVRR